MEGSLWFRNNSLEEHIYVNYFTCLAIHCMHLQMIIITLPMWVSLSFSFWTIVTILGLFWLSFSTHFSAIWVHVSIW